MKTKNAHALTLGSVLLLAVSQMTHADIDFLGINHWVGSGANQSALVIDWNDGIGTESFVWGYRFDGAVTAETMFLDVVASDPYLYARVGTDGGFGIPVYGIGYDLDQDGFSVDDGIVFNGLGLAVTGDPLNPEEGDKLDADDHYLEGWWTGFWGQTETVSTGSPYGGSGVWTNGLGLIQHDLADGTWTGLSFAPGFASSDPSEPISAPLSAVPEPSTLALFILGVCGLIGGRMALCHQRK